MSKWSECAHTSGVWRVCARGLAHAAFTRGVGINAWRRACLKRGANATFQAPTEASANQIASCKYPIPFMQHQRSMWLVVVTRRVSTTLQTRPPSSVDADAPCECSVSQSVRTHTSHTGLTVTDRFRNCHRSDAHMSWRCFGFVLAHPIYIQTISQALIWSIHDGVYHPWCFYNEFCPPMAFSCLSPAFSIRMSSHLDRRFEKCVGK